MIASRESKRGIVPKKDRFRVRVNDTPTPRFFMIHFIDPHEQRAWLQLGHDHNYGA